jgi:hypothetical protein
MDGIREAIGATATAREQNDEIASHTQAVLLIIFPSLRSVCHI